MTSVTIYAFANEVGMSYTHIKRLVKNGTIPSNSDGKIPLEEGLKAFNNRKNKKQDASPEAGNVREETAKAKLAKETYIAKLKELDYRYRKGELVEVEDVRAEAQRVAAAVMDKFKAIPPRIAVLCEGRSARDIEAIIADAHNEAFAALHSKFK